MRGVISSSNPEYHFQWFTGGDIRKSIQGPIRKKLTELLQIGFGMEYDYAQEALWEGIEGQDWYRVNVVSNQGIPVAMSTQTLVLGRTDALFLGDAIVEESHRRNGILKTILLDTLNSTQYINPDLQNLYAHVDPSAPHYAFMCRQGFQVSKDWLLGVYPTEGFDLLYKKL